MAEASVDKPQWTAGELKGELAARSDLQSYSAGADIIENLVVLPEGGLTRRPPTRFVIEATDSAQAAALMPFKFKRNDARILFLNANVAQVMKPGGAYVLSGGAPYTFAHPFAAADLPKLRWTESANEIFVAWGQKQKVIQRLADDNWTVGDYDAVNGPVMAQNIDIAKTITISSLTGTTSLTATADIFLPGHVGSTWRLDESDLSLVPYWTADEDVATISSAPDPAASFRRYKGNVYWAKPPTGQPDGPYNCGVNPPTQQFGDFQSTPGGVIWTWMYAGYGYVKITAVADARHATATVQGVARTAQTQLPNSLLTKPTYRWYEAAWSDVRGWPDLVSFLQQRLVWYRGYEVWGSNTADYFRFEISDAPDSAFYLPLLSMDGSVLEARWAVSPGWMVIGCSDAEPVVRGPGAFDAITQTNAINVVDKGQGSCTHRPAISDAGVIHIGTSRERLHFAKIDRLYDTLAVTEISTPSTHILRGKAAGVTYQHDPHRLCWGYSQNGDLWCYTFRPDQQVIAGHRHPMPNGFVEDMAVIPTADETAIEVWLIVRRVIDGVTRRYVEVMTQFFRDGGTVPTALGAGYVDCFAEYAGAPTNLLTGLGYLKGELVRVFSNGAQIGDFTVAVDRITLPSAVTAARVGKPSAFRARTLALDPAVRPGAAPRAAAKLATHAAVDLFESSGGVVTVYDQDEESGGWNVGEPEALIETGNAPLAPGPVKLFTGRKIVPLDAAHARAVKVEVSGDHAYPFTLLSIAPDIIEGEG